MPVCLLCTPPDVVLPSPSVALWFTPAAGACSWDGEDQAEAKGGRERREEAEDIRDADAVSLQTQQRSEPAHNINIK